MKPAEKFVFIWYFCLVTYLDFLRAGIFHDGTSNKKCFEEIYLVQFSVNYKTPFFDASQSLVDNFLSYSLRDFQQRNKNDRSPP